MKFDIKASWRTWIAVALPAGLFAIHFLQGLVIASFDTTNLFYVGRRWFWTEVRKGHFPIWNEHIFAGFNQLSSPANAWLSPVSAVFYNLFPGVWAEELQIPFFAALAGLGMFFWLRKVTKSENAALFGALAFALSGPFLSLTDRSLIFFAVALYPWAFLFQVQFLEGRHGRAGLLALTLAMIMIHADWVGAALTFVLLLIGTRNLKEAARVAACIAWGLSIAALSFIPTLLGVSEMTRAGGFTLAQSSYYSFHPARLLSFILPEAWGQIYKHNFFGQAVANAYQVDRFWYHSIYISLPVLLLAVFGLIQARFQKRTYIYLAIALFCLLVSLGKHFAVHEFLFNFAPGYASLRFPEKFLIYFTFGIFVCAAVTVPRFSKWRELFGVIAAIHCAAFATHGFWSDLAARTASMTIEFNAHLFLTVVAAAITVNIHKIPVRAITLILIAFTATELLFFAPKQNLVSYQTFSQRSPFVSELKSGRYVRDTNLNRFSGDVDRESLQPNWAMLEGIKDVFGYESVTPSRSERLIGSELFRQLDSWAGPLNITHVVTTIKPREKNLAEYAQKGFLQPVAKDEAVNAVALKLERAARDYEAVCSFELVADDNAAFEKTRARGINREPLVIEPRIDKSGQRVTPDYPSTEPAPNPKAQGKNECVAQIQPTARTSEHREYSVSAQTPVWLVERESYSPAWKATLDGTDTPVWPADFINRAVYIPAGEHRVSLSFEPRGFRLSALLSCLGFAALIIYGLTILAKSTIPKLSRAT